MLSRLFAPAVRASFVRRFASQQKIFYTNTDEAPMLATYALLPIIRRFTDPVLPLCFQFVCVCSCVCFFLLQLYLSFPVDVF
jgi:hypothetical protein